jgi:predicted metal-dependent phosphoesterase TrpH
MSIEADLHIHTSRYSGCSNIDPVEALRTAARVGLDVIALTEHGIRWPDEELSSLIDDSGVEGLLVIPGQEAACYSHLGVFQGEFLVYGYPRSLGSNKSAQQLIEMVHAEGGVVVAAHPFKKAQTGGSFYGSGHLTRDLDLDGLEIEHPAYDAEGRQLARETMEAMQITGIGCSDAHDLRNIGQCRTLFQDNIDSVTSLCQAIRNGRVEALGARKML